MQKLTLQYTQELKGKFSLSKLNFLFVFQVNCPGCFLYGIPVVNKLFQEFKDQISFLGISTAFEDFEYNNIKNTNLLLTNNIVVGETKKALLQHGLLDKPIPIDFPVAMDEKASKDFDIDFAAKHICATHDAYVSWSKEVQASVYHNVISYLKNQKTISKTFTLNQLKGTPTMILFNDSYEILLHQFGHVHYTALRTKLLSHIETSN
ncbi:hypothetical protein [Aquimarina sp. AU474]|uniref:hypothetical protein n=1 Tax=Aquimarina sp. AU474 TaxID=2108529 RepID=UPI00135CEE9B|nr:hypothetical protein [Aquimarina sp. AU474]